MVQRKKQIKDKPKRKLIVRKESLKDLSVKDAQKVRGGAVPQSYMAVCGQK